LAANVRHDSRVVGPVAEEWRGRFFAAANLGRVGSLTLQPAVAVFSVTEVSDDLMEI
jgi:hypothetical protein